MWFWFVIAYSVYEGYVANEFDTNLFMTSNDALHPALALPS